MSKKSRLKKKTQKKRNKQIISRSRKLLQYSKGELMALQDYCRINKKIEGISESELKEVITQYHLNTGIQKIDMTTVAPISKVPENGHLVDIADSEKIK